MAQQLAINGKDGSGMTTIAANLAAALAETGKRVLLVGCSRARRFSSGHGRCGCLWMITRFRWLSRELAADGKPTSGQAPVDWRLAVFGKIGVGLGKMAASQKAAVGRQW